jgi:hypothetical protein
LQNFVSIQPRTSPVKFAGTGEYMAPMSASMPHLSRALSPSRASLSQHVVAESPEPRGAELVEERSSSELSRSTARRLF